LTKAQVTWGRIGKVIRRKTDANPNVVATFYKAIIQSILLYGSKSWTINTTILNELDSFHKRYTRYIVGQHIKMLEDGSWSYPSTKDTLEAAGLLTIQEYIETRKNMVKQYV
jgi:hypothetical protein